MHHRELTIIRKQQIEQYIDLKDASLLEIGALDTPTYTKTDASIKYLDYASKEELISSNEDNPRYTDSRLMEVDFVCPTPEYSKFIKEKFDLVIANHVIEHVKDMISWINEISTIVKPNGYLFLSIPDKRYTFDIVRQETSFVTLLKNFEEKAKKPGLPEIFDALYYYRPVKAVDVWQDNYQDKIEMKRFSVSRALELAREYAQKSYFDIHCHVFTVHSFEECMKMLIETQLVKFTIVEIIEPVYMGNEFNVILKSV